MTTFPDQVRQYGGVPAGVNRLAEIFQSGNIWFVDNVNGSSSYTGKRPDWAVDLPSTAVGKASKGGIIYVKPSPPDAVGLTWIRDSIDISAAKSNISIIGAGGEMDEMAGVSLRPTAAGVGDHLIDVLGAGLRLENLRLTMNGGTAASGKNIVNAICTYSGGWTAFPVGLHIVNCVFGDDVNHPSVGPTPTGSVTLGSASFTTIEGCTFYNCLGGVTIHSLVMSPYNIKILNNVFSGDTTRRDGDIIISINSGDSNGIIIHGNIFADGLPAHSGGETLRFIKFPYVTAGTGIISHNWFACLSDEAQFGESGTHSVIADNFFQCDNKLEGAGTTAPYGIITS